MCLVLVITTDMASETTCSGCGGDPSLEDPGDEANIGIDRWFGARLTQCKEIGAFPI